MKNYKITSEEIELLIANKFDYLQNIIVPNVRGLGFHECDMLVCSKHGHLTEIEIKISMSDLKSDFSKQHGHRSEYVKRFYYAFPDYMEVSATPLIPEHCGIIVIRKNPPKDYYLYDVEIVRDPKPNPGYKKIPEDKILRLLHLGLIRTWKYRINQIQTNENVDILSTTTKYLLEIIGMGEYKISELKEMWRIFEFVLNKKKDNYALINYGYPANMNQENRKRINGKWDYGVSAKDQIDCRRDFDNHTRIMEIECFNPT